MLGQQKMHGGSTDIKWRGHIYHVAWNVIDGCVRVEVTPENLELAGIVKQDIESNDFQSLPVGYGWGFKYLKSDVHRGESDAPPTILDLH